MPSRPTHAGLMPDFRGANRNHRDYDVRHDKARAAAFARLPDYSPCVRCGRLMWKHAKERNGKSALHFDHSDDRTHYLGFSHSRCNREAGAAKGGRLALAKRSHTTPTPRRWTSRAW